MLSPFADCVCVCACVSVCVDAHFLQLKKRPAAKVKVNPPLICCAQNYCRHTQKTKSTCVQALGRTSLSDKEERGPHNHL